MSLTGLSWIPYVFCSVCLVTPPSFVRHHFPSSSIIDGFSRALYGDTNLVSIQMGGKPTEIAVTEFC